MSDNMDTFCQSYCVCIRFAIPKEAIERVEKEVKSKEYKKKVSNEMKKVKGKGRFEIKWGVPKTKEEDVEKRIFAVSLTSSPEHFSDEVLDKCFPVLQKRMDDLKQYGIKEFEATTCVEFGFRLKRFKPVGELVLPAQLSLRPELSEKLGKSKLSGFEIDFEKSPLGLEGVILNVDEEEDILSITINSSFQTSLEDIIKNAYMHGKRIANLFVEERK